MNLGTKFPLEYLRCVRARLQDYHGGGGASLEQNPTFENLVSLLHKTEHQVCVNVICSFGGGTC